MAAFLGEIKRRKVFQIAAVYAVMAWLIIQVVDVVNEPLNLPDWLDTVVIVLLAVGFPIAVVLAWAFDLTPAGIERQTGKPGAGATTQLQGQSLNLAIQALVLLAVGFLVLDQYLIETRLRPGAASPGAAAEEITRFEYHLPEGHALRNTARPVVAISRDGRQFAYNTVHGIYLRRMDQLDARLVPGTEPNLNSPIFSWDGTELAYWDWGARPQQLIRIGVRGGAPVPIVEVPRLLDGLSWAADGTILYGQADGVYRVSLTDGTPERIVRPEDGSQIYGPRLLPDGDQVLFSEGTPPDWDEARIVLQSRITGQRTELDVFGNDVRYLPTGHLVYARGDTLFAVPFDLDSLTVSGTSMPVVQEVTRGLSGGGANYDVADNGTLVYLTGDPAPQVSELLWVDRERNEQPIPAQRLDSYSIRLSPDERFVAATIWEEGDDDIHFYDLQRRGPNWDRRTFGEAEDRHSVWTPDGEEIVYVSVQSGEYRLYRTAVDGSTPDQPITEPSEFRLVPESFSPDGMWLVYLEENQTSSDLYVLSMEDFSRRPLLADDRYDEAMSAISPRGERIAYVSNESGTREVYVAPFPNPNDVKAQVSTDGGVDPAWGPGGDELFYLVVDDAVTLIAAEVEAENGFRVLSRMELLEDNYEFAVDGYPNYAVSRDGRRFLMQRPVMLSDAESEPPRIIVVENWLEELARLVPLR